MEAGGVKSLRFLVETLEGLEDFAGSCHCRVRAVWQAEKAMAAPRGWTISFVSGRAAFVVAGCLFLI